MRVDVVVTADAVAPGEVTGRTALVVDVLRASTTIITALAHGCAAVVPVASPAEARRRAGQAAGPVLLGGERGGEPIPGFDVGNSPVEVADGRLRGATLFFTTSNGTRALLAGRGAAAVGVAALVNVGAAAAWAAASGRDVIVLCAGERGRPCLEDEVAAGLLVDRLLRSRADATAGPAAATARAAAGRYAADVGRLRDDASWARHLVGRGREADVAACLAVDALSLVPEYLPAVDKVVGARRQ